MISVAGVIGIGTLLLIVVSGIVVAMLRPTLNSTVGQALATPTVDQNRTVLETQVAVLLTQRPVLVDTPSRGSECARHCDAGCVPGCRCVAGARGIAGASDRCHRPQHSGVPVDAGGGASTAIRAVVAAQRGSASRQCTQDGWWRSACRQHPGQAPT